MNLTPSVGVLSGDEIERLSNRDHLRTGREPLIDDLEPTNLKGAAYDLRMAADGMALPNGLVIRPKEGPLRSPVILEPGQTAFISTRERLDLPTSITGNISIKGALALQGVLLLTGLIVDPGYKGGGSGDGRLHFRLANLGKRAVLLEPGETKIASIQFLRMADVSARDPGHSFDYVWETVDELQDGLGFLEDLRTLAARMTNLDNEVSRQGRSISLVVTAVMAVVATTLLGIVVAGLLTLGSSVNLVRSANRVVANSTSGRIVEVLALFGLAAIVAALVSPFRRRREYPPVDPSGVAYARAEALRDLRAERIRCISLATILFALLVVGGIAATLDLGVPWWISSVVVMLALAVGLWRRWDFVWQPLPRKRVDDRVRNWEREALEQ
jgi:dCTP deaminase